MRCVRARRKHGITIFIILIRGRGRRACALFAAGQRRRRFSSSPQSAGHDHGGVIVLSFANRFSPFTVFISFVSALGSGPRCSRRAFRQLESDCSATRSSTREITGRGTADRTRRSRRSVNDEQRRRRVLSPGIFSRRVPTPLDRRTRRTWRTRRA